MNMQAVRAFNRVFNPIMESIFHSYDLDAQFSGGEFIGQSFDRIMDDEYERCLTKVGARYDMTWCELAQMCEKAAWKQSEYNLAEYDRIHSDPLA